MYAIISTLDYCVELGEIYVILEYLDPLSHCHSKPPLVECLDHSIIPSLTILGANTTMYHIGTIHPL